MIAYMPGELCYQLLFLLTAYQLTISRRRRYFAWSAGYVLLLTFVGYLAIPPFGPLGYVGAHVSAAVLMLCATAAICWHTGHVRASFVSLAVVLVGLMALLSAGSFYLLDHPEAEAWRLIGLVPVGVTAAIAARDCLAACAHRWRTSVTQGAGTRKPAVRLATRSLLGKRPNCGPSFANCNGSCRCPCKACCSAALAGATTHIPNGTARTGRFSCIFRGQPEPASPWRPAHPGSTCRCRATRRRTARPSATISNSASCAIPGIVSFPAFSIMSAAKADAHWPNGRLWSRKHLREYPNFENFVLALQDTTVRRPIMAYPHFRPQLDWLTLPRSTKAYVDFAGRFETLAEDFSIVAKRLGLREPLPTGNASEHQPYRDAYSKRMRAIVADLYAADIDAFDYSF